VENIEVISSILLLLVVLDAACPRGTLGLPNGEGERDGDPGALPETIDKLETVFREPYVGIDRKMVRLMYISIECVLNVVPNPNVF
jgi:hypothetical protein